MATAQDTTRPQVVLVSLSSQPWFDEMYAALLTALQSRARLRRVRKADSAVRILSADDERPPAVILTDEALTRAENAAVWDAVLAYVRTGGGTCVIMGLFPGFVPPPEMKPFFARAGLPWEAGSYYRTTFALNRAAVPAADRDGDRGVGVAAARRLLPRYSQKALFVKNVAEADAWYLPEDESVVESRVFPPTSVRDSVGETPVAFASVGRGKIGYVGDVNAEEGSDTVILAMCGL